LANLALVEWPDNAKISDQAPAAYWPGMASRFPDRDLKPQLYWHGLPDGWETLAYGDFLDERQRRLAAVIRDGFERLRERSAPKEAQAEQELAVHAKETVGRPTLALLSEGEGAFIEFKESAR
jgi:hypothetical protein